MDRSGHSCWMPSPPAKPCNSTSGNTMRDLRWCCWRETIKWSKIHFIAPHQTFSFFPLQHRFSLLYPKAFLIAIRKAAEQQITARHPSFCPTCPVVCPPPGIPLRHAHYYTPKNSKESSKPIIFSACRRPAPAAATICVATGAQHNPAQACRSTPPTLVDLHALEGKARALPSQPTSPHLPPLVVHISKTALPFVLRDRSICSQSRACTRSSPTWHIDDFI